MLIANAPNGLIQCDCKFLNRLGVAVSYAESIKPKVQNAHCTWRLHPPQPHGTNIEHTAHTCARCTGPINRHTRTRAHTQIGTSSRCSRLSDAHKFRSHKIKMHFIERETQWDRRQRRWCRKRNKSNACCRRRYEICIWLVARWPPFCHHHAICTSCASAHWLQHRAARSTHGLADKTNNAAVKSRYFI